MTVIGKEEMDLPRSRISSFRVRAHAAYGVYWINQRGQASLLSMTTNNGMFGVVSG